MYDFVLVGRYRVEVCDDCGFNGTQTPIGDVPVRLRDLRRDWSAALAADEELLRRRPSDTTWCVIEYAAHTASMLEAIEWGAREFLKGRAPDWGELPVTLVPAEDATETNHDCTQIHVDQLDAAIERSTQSLATFAQSLSAEDLRVVQDYGGGLLLTVEAVICHALHDAEHHVLDIRRGMATMLLADARKASRAFFS